MAGQPTTRLQISGYRFLLRRMEHALVRGDVRMLDDPLRAQLLSLMAGAALAVILVAGCAILAFLQPRVALGTATVVMVRDSGALYVRIGDTMHPALNLASARLITGSTAKPELVGASALDTAKRGPTIGIPGAPNEIRAPVGSDDFAWTVCDETDRTTVIVGKATGDLAQHGNALVTARAESAATTYLLYDGRRAKVDLRNQAVVRALKLDGQAPRPVSRALLDAIPEAPEITVPYIPDAGTAGPAMLRGFTVGTVVRLTRAGSAEFYVVLAHGIQRVGAVAADLIRFTYSHGVGIATVAPSVIGSVQIVDELPVASYPYLGGISGGRVLCARWGVNTAVLMGDSLPLSGHDSAVQLARADGDGPGVDAVVVSGSGSAFVRAVGVRGEGSGSGALFLVTESGVVFGVHDEEAAKRLGLTTTPLPAPWPVLSRLPRGPELSVAAASVVRDSIGTPP